MHDNGIEELITKLYDMVQDARSLPLGADKCIVERDKVLDMLDEISNQLPGELKQAKTIVDSRNELIAKAKREAEGAGTPGPGPGQAAGFPGSHLQGSPGPCRGNDPHSTGEDQRAEAGHQRLCG